ncbi:MAG: Rrf2 family transcriptional regulator [Clostridia bacterium]|nr:Rrf2 family transcriptional regulator [Clostridia bacterium]
MKISASGEVSVRMLVEIAKKSDFVSLKEVAQSLNISLKYAEKMASILSKGGMLESLRGQDGGYKLAKSAELLTVREVLELTGDIKPVVACLQTDCPHKETCTSVSVWEKLNALINDYLGKITIQSLMN